MIKPITAGALALAITTTTMVGCKSGEQSTPDFDYTVDRFADIEVLRYQVPGFENLTLNQKLLIYYLTEAAISGRDILWDQNGKYNLALRDMLEQVYESYDGPKDDQQWQAFDKYVKQVWFGNGVHHHYSMDKFVPEFAANGLRAN